MGSSRKASLLIPYFKTLIAVPILRGKEKGKRITKVVVKSNAFLLDQVLGDKITRCNREESNISIAILKQETINWIAS